MQPQGHSRRAVSKLLDCLSHEIEQQQPKNVIHFMVDFLCKNYASHLRGFAHVWDVDAELEKEKKLVIEFFKSQKLTTEIARHFINVGFDSMESLLYVNPHILDDVEKFNKVNWLPGHKIRLQQMFSDIEENIKKFYEECEKGGPKNIPDYNLLRVSHKERIKMVVAHPAGSSFQLPHVAISNLLSCHSFLNCLCSNKHAIRYCHRSITLEIRINRKEKMQHVV
ncbi:conserved Plasmodium protein, unknown function [Plasmodium ovale curtisi]|uniref:Uncharacterized protein n=1 Tax=Plasmodium ovale curtisi TaxID=864141 RepID=A0A1A8VWE8_PLAOA|nr:conserved Plasmodium protein, unknown function [Plasmodium ovale curtisi]